MVIRRWIVLAGVVAIACKSRRIPDDAAVWRSATMMDAVPQSVEAAESRGARLARNAAAEAVPADMAARPRVGSANRACVDVGSSDVARSGDFYAGGFTNYAATWPARPYGPQLWWQAVHELPEGHTARFMLRVTRLDADSEDFVYETASFARPAGTEGREPAGPAGRTNLRLPDRGKWLFVATVDNDWGCFVFAF